MPLVEALVSSSRIAFPKVPLAEHLRQIVPVAQTIWAFSVVCVYDIEIGH